MKMKTLNEENKVLGNKIASLRIKNKWSQEKLASKLQLCGLDISRATLSKIELGTRQLYAVELKHFANIFNVNINELLS